MGQRMSQGFWPLSHALASYETSALKLKFKNKIKDVKAMTAEHQTKCETLMNMGPCAIALATHP